MVWLGSTFFGGLHDKDFIKLLTILYIIIDALQSITYYVT